jgi:hypothetical protein
LTIHKPKKLISLLNSQIAKWKDYLKPILAGSEARSKIDMHQCGIEMVEKIGNVNDTVTLDEITETGKTPSYFLTMLQLVSELSKHFSLSLLKHF